MKKYILILLLITTMVPSVALAAWWNPFTWNIFQKKQPVVEQVVSVPQVTEEKADKPVESTTQVSLPTFNTNTNTNLSEPAKTLISCNGQSYEDTCTAQGLKLFCGPDKLFCGTQQQVDNFKVCNGVTYDGTCGVGTEFLCPSSGKPYCGTSATQLLIDRIDESQRKEDNFQRQQEERRNSSECKEASTSLNKIREEIKSAREKSDRYYNEYKANNSDSSFLKYMEYSREDTNLSSKQSLLLADYYRICEGTSVIPPIPKTYNTTCYTNSYGMINCTTY